MWVNDYQTELTRFVVDRAVAAKRLPAMVDATDPRTGQTYQIPASQTVTLTGPEIAAADAELTANVLLNLSTALTGMVESGVLSPEASKVAARKAWESYMGIPYTAELDSPEANPDDVATAVDDAQAAEAKRGKRHGGDTAQLRDYWTRGEGLAKWADSPPPVDGAAESPAQVHPQPGQGGPYGRAVVPRGQRLLAWRSARPEPGRAWLREGVPMDRFEAGRMLGLADADVLGVQETEHGTKVAVRDGGDRLITAGGVFALTDHPATSGLRRWRQAEPEVQPAADVEEPAPSTTPPPADPPAEVPDGSVEDVMAWVGQDAERAAKALAVEESREHPRSTLAAKLRKLAAG
jgi:hypothetical protein